MEVIQIKYFSVTKIKLVLDQWYHLQSTLLVRKKSFLKNLFIF